MNFRPQSVWDYMHDSETLLKTDELSEAETRAMQEMLKRLSKKLLIHETSEEPPHSGNVDDSYQPSPFGRGIDHDYHGC